jgi:hypothetical protein
LKSFFIIIQRLDIGDCPRLRMVSAGAFTRLPSLQFLRLANNARLRFISPLALRPGSSNSSSSSSTLFEFVFSKLFPLNLSYNIKK